MNLKNKNFLLILLTIFISMGCNIQQSNKAKKNRHTNISQQKETLITNNIIRSMAITDATFKHYFKGDNQVMARFYNPIEDKSSSEIGSVWMYSASIEAINTILQALKTQKLMGKDSLHNIHYNRYENLLTRLYDNLEYYSGTFEHTSFTQTKDWTVYGVNRGAKKGQAKVAGIENVYDDQQWLIRELLHSYKITDNKHYLKKAEYLTEYVIDGWDSTLDAFGKPNGGIPWGPGYTTKHSCSNGPFISPLIWLYELYKDKNDELTYLYISPTGERIEKKVKKSSYYLQFAKDIYHWQKSKLIRSDGIYDDFLGGCDPDCAVAYEVVNGTTYRANTKLKDVVGPAYSYNTGAMLSGAVDLFRATSNKEYLEDVKSLGKMSFRYFAKESNTLPGYYEYATSGFNNWFNGVLMRAFIYANTYDPNTELYIETFQKNLNYGYEKFAKKNLLPTNLLHGWDPKNADVEGMFQLTFAAEYALLATYEMVKIISTNK